METSAVMTELGEMFGTFSRCVMQVSARDRDGDLHSGTCFHIGDGYFVTARHVVEGMRAVSVDEREISDAEIAFADDESVDLALLKTDLRLSPDRHVYADGRFQNLAGAISIGSHLDDWLNDEAFITQKVLVIGYPPIPTSAKPVQVAVEAEVVAVVDRYLGPHHPHFVLSNVPRGGFSGGPVLMAGFLLGVVTESLLEAGQPLEAGYSAALTVEPLLTLMGRRRIFPAGWNGDWARELEDGPWEFPDDWYRTADDYMPPPLPWWFPIRARAYRLATRYDKLSPLARRLTFHSRFGWPSQKDGSSR